MENEILMDDAHRNDEKNYKSWELSGDDNPNETSTLSSEGREKPALQKKADKNSAAKAASHAQSAVSNTNPNIRTGLSDEINDTGTNVAYTERES